MSAASDTVKKIVSLVHLGMWDELVREVNKDISEEVVELLQDTEPCVQESVFWASTETICDGYEDAIIAEHAEQIFNALRKYRQGVKQCGL